jgi:hypothetical protein
VLSAKSSAVSCAEIVNKSDNNLESPLEHLFDPFYSHSVVDLLKRDPYSWLPQMTDEAAAFLQRISLFNSQFPDRETLHSLILKTGVILPDVYENSEVLQTFQILLKEVSINSILNFVREKEAEAPRSCLAIACFASDLPRFLHVCLDHSKHTKLIELFWSFKYYDAILGKVTRCARS